MEWQPIETAPTNGKQFICWNGEEMLILNKPKGHALGRWEKISKKWTGSFVRFDNPTHWMPLPPPPNTGG
jgi:hypothetical protein